MEGCDELGWMLGAGGIAGGAAARSVAGWLPGRAGEACGGLRGVPAGGAGDGGARAGVCAGRRGRAADGGTSAVRCTPPSHSLVNTNKFPKLCGLGRFWAPGSHEIVNPALGGVGLCCLVVLFLDL